MSTNDIIATDLQSQELDPIVELYELKLSETTTLFFHSGNDSSLDTVKFHPINVPNDNTEEDANEYVEMPIMMEGIEFTSQGASNRPVVTIANVASIFKGLLNDESFSFQDLVGAKLTKRTTLAKYLVGGSEEDNPFEFPIASYFIDRISGESSMMVELELALPFDVEGIKLPNRSIIGKYCAWVYQGAETTGQSGCNWPESNTIEFVDEDSSQTLTFTAFFDVEDRPLVPSATFSSESVTYTGSHSKDDYVTYNSKKWRSEVDSNTETPSETSSFWIQVFTYNNWSSGTSYSVGDYVRYSNKIWKAAKASSAKTPTAGSIYWVRQDYCSKKLSGCKCRFQFSPRTGGLLPSANKETDKSLPFGGFPASVKFK